MSNSVAGTPQIVAADQPVTDVDAALARLGDIILGKERQLRLALACLLARGHLLIEDLPGVGKTTLAHALAGVLGLHYQRIQFTSCLLYTSDAADDSVLV